MQANRLETLYEACSTAAIVRVWREPIEGPNASMRGYVTECSDDLVCVLVIDDRVLFNGYEVIRIQDVSAVESPCAQASFIERVLRLRGQSVERAPEVRLSSMRAAVESISAAVPILTVHRELVDPDTCLIGRPTRFEAERMLLLELDANALWAERPTEVDYAEITRIDFGGGYEQALLLVAGLPPDVGDPG